MVHSLCLDLTGHNLYSFGRGDYGQLGITLNRPKEGYLQNEPKPVYLNRALATEDGLVKENPKIRSITCGDHHSMAVTEDGDLYTWGFGEEGQLGQGHENDSYCPQKVLEGGVIHASGGSQHTVVLTRKKIADTELMKGR